MFPRHSFEVPNRGYIETARNLLVLQVQGLCGTNPILVPQILDDVRPSSG